MNSIKRSENTNLTHQSDKKGHNSSHFHMIITHFADYNNYACGQIKKSYTVHTSWLSLLRTSHPNLRKKKKTSTLTLKKSKNKTGSSEYMISDYYRILDLLDHVQLVGVSSVASAHPTRLD